MKTPATRLLTAQDVARVIDMPTAIRVVRQAFRVAARGQATMPPKVYLPLPHQSDFRAMPAFLQRPAACGIKWVNVHPSNRRRGLPTVMAIIVINDPATGVPLAVMDGLLMTKLRTAAAAVVAAQALARPASRVVGLVGCGAQAEPQVQALAAAFALRRIHVWGYFPGEARQFCLAIQRVLPRVEFVACRTIESCVRQVDIVVTLTPARRPLVRRAWVSAGTHINAIGADAPGKQELDPRILQEATVVVDDREQALHAGEINVPIARGQFRARDIHATLGDVLLGHQRGRRRPDELTVFDSTGVAIHDVALGWAIFQRAMKLGVGRTINFFSLV